MESAKEKMLKFIEQLPDNLTEEEITYHLYVREEIRKARKQAKEGKTTPHATVKEKYEQWLI